MLPGSSPPLDNEGEWRPPRKFSERLQIVREMLAAGLSPEEIKEKLGEPECYVIPCLKKALADQTAKRYSEEEEGLLRMAYGQLPTEVLAAALGRTKHAVYMWAHRHGRGSATLVCNACGGKMEIAGLPVAVTQPLSGEVIWCYRCKKCGNEVLFRFTWRGRKQGESEGGDQEEVISYAVEEHEGSSTEP